MKVLPEYEHGAYGPTSPLLNQPQREVHHGPIESGGVTHGSSTDSDTHGRGEARNDTYGSFPHPPNQNHVYHGPQPCVTAQPCVSSPEALNHGYHRLDDHTQGSIRKHALFDDSDPHRKALFRLHRELQPIAHRERWTENHWKAVVAYWMKASHRNGVHLPGFDTVWAEFKRKRDGIINEPFGRALERATARVPDVVVPEPLQGSHLEPVARVMIAFAEEATLRGDANFHLASRKIAELAKGISAMTALRHLGALRSKGFVSLIEAGQHEGPPCRRKANTWRWHDPPCPAETVWNSNTIQRAARRR